MKIRMTDLSIKKLAAKPGQRIEYFDNATAGLCLRVNGPTERAKDGSKVWSLYHRHGGKLSRLTLGSYPELGLAAARVAAAKAQGDLKAGTDPRTARKAAEVDAAPVITTVADVAADWVERRLVKLGRAAGYIRNVKLDLQNHILPVIGDRDVTTITRREINRLIDNVADGESRGGPGTGPRAPKGGPVCANHVRAILQPLFSFAAKRDLITASPAADVDRPSDPQSRERVLNAGELTLVLQAADRLDHPQSGFTKVLAMTGQRRTEVGSMRWQDVDLDAAVWTIPAAMNKSGRVHKVPLVPQVVDLLRSLPRFAGSAWVFTSSGAAPIGSYGQSKKQLDATIRKLHGSPLKPWRYHDLRRTATTGMAEIGTQPHVVSEVLNHARKGVTATTYDKYDYAKEKRTALQAWADHLDTLHPTPSSAEVIKLRA
jgi:integrase